MRKKTRTGLAGSFVSGICFVISAVFLFKLAFLLFKNTLAALISVAIFITNPNILYLQTTPMTEIPLICFFILSTYYFVKFLNNEKEAIYLVLAALFGFCATLSRYDGWFLVGIEALVLVASLIKQKVSFGKIQGLFVLFSTLAFLGIVIWMSWDFLILGDPLYFTNSEFSAKHQQQNWLAKGELPAFHNIFLSFDYYFVTSMSTSGFVIFFVSLIGLFIFLKDKKIKLRFYVALVLLVPFIFYVLTLYVGQSVIFIPHITPSSFEWRLFNVRYGAMMIPVVAIFFGFLFFRVKPGVKAVLVGLIIIQLFLYMSGYSKVIVLSDGVEGVSASKKDSAQIWLRDHYDNGLVLIDDYARSVSIIQTNIPMQKIIYIGNKPYWDDEMKKPEKYATWIVMQKNDAVWTNIYDNPATQARLYKYFQKVFTSPEILIFKKVDNHAKEPSSDH